MAPAGPVRDILALSFDETAGLLASRTRAVALRKWLYSVHPVPEGLPARVPGVTTPALATLRDAVTFPPWRLVRRIVAADGPVKYVLAFGAATVETVLIPGYRRSTVCVSSQAGCTRRCVFCATATLGFTRQLTAGEILVQYLVAAAEAPPGQPARNVVFMGMGEPLDNLDAVLLAVQRLTENPVPGLAESHVTVSTSGVLPGLARFLAEGRGQLALSLSATRDEQRESLIPHARQWPIATLLETLRRDPRAAPNRRHLIAYVLWRDVNDSDADAARLGALLAGLPVHVNLIPHNDTSHTTLTAPSPERIARFHALVNAAGVRCIIRRPRGVDAAAACGQLALRERVGEV
jgi:23S rRNA (adenine2503-C2)-methyltransferase